MVFGGFVRKMCWPDVYLHRLAFPALAGGAYAQLRINHAAAIGVQTLEVSASQAPEGRRNDVDR